VAMFAGLVWLYFHEPRAPGRAPEDEKGRESI
jgi:hypothetical protein